MTARIFFKLIVGVLLVMAVALATIDLLASGMAERAYKEDLRASLEAKIRMLAVIDRGRLSQMAPESLRDLAKAAGGRLTIVAPGGRVIYDSEANAATMDNHAGRPEVQAALQGRFGSLIRQSGTLGVDFLYVAGPVPSGVARIAMPLTTISGQMAHIRNRLLIYSVVGFLPAIVLAAFFARYFSRKLGRIVDYTNALAKGDFKAELTGMGNDELGSLGNTLSKTGAKLQTLLETMEKEHAAMEKLERVRKDFVINVSHELRTPLASIQGYTETLIDGALYDSENNLKFLNIIRQNAERLGRLTADLLTISRIELKTQEFQFASYDVNALLADCIDSMRPIAQKNRVALIQVPAPPATEVFCDSEAVHQIMSNLLDNALKYTSEGGAITVSARPLLAASGESPALEIAVSDTGIGIPPEDQPRLFERFYRVDKARSRELGGTGLGLAIVKHLTRAHGGDVRVESSIGQGATFAFTLPTTINETVMAP